MPPCPPRLALLGLALGLALEVALGLSLATSVVSCGARTELQDPGTQWDYDGAVPDGVVRSDCPDSGATYVYALTNRNQLLSFHAPTHTFSKVAVLDCPAFGDTPNSMAIDRKGTAYVGFQNGNIYQVSTKTGACTPTSWTPLTGAFREFGMGIATDRGGPSETLYLASYEDALDGFEHLGSVRLSDLTFGDLGALPSSVHHAELTGTGDGRLYAFYRPNTPVEEDAHLAQIDKATGAILDDRKLAGVLQGTAWAVSFWGGDFFFFTAATRTQSIVTRLRPSDSTLIRVASYDEPIVGAGVSTCAPEN